MPAARLVRHLPLALGTLLIVLIVAALAAAPAACAQSALADAHDAARAAGHERFTVVLGADGAGVALLGDRVEPRLGGAVAPADRVERTADGLRILADDGATMAEVRLDDVDTRPDLRWIWSPRAWSVVQLKEGALGLTVRGLDDAEAARLDGPRAGALVVTQVAAASHAAAAGLVPGDVLTHVAGAPATPLRLVEAARTLRAGQPVPLRLRPDASAETPAPATTLTLDPDADLAGVPAPAAWAVTVATAAGDKVEATFAGRRLRLRANGRRVHLGALALDTARPLRLAPDAGAPPLAVPTPATLADEARALAPDAPADAPRGFLRLDAPDASGTPGAPSDDGDAATEGLRLLVVGDAVRATTAAGQPLAVQRDGATFTLTDPATGALRFDVRFDADAGRFWWWRAKGE
jgi:hypothetical protein